MKVTKSAFPTFSTTASLAQKIASACANEARLRAAATTAGQCKYMGKQTRADDGEEYSL